MRPTEVVFEGEIFCSNLLLISRSEWKKLRDQGIQTPDLVVWNKVQGEDNMWQEYLDRIYNNPSYSDMILKQDETGMQVFWVPWHYSSVNETSIRMLELNGGRKNM